MSQDWADKIAQQLLSRGLIQTGICLLLGAADTGKTTLAAALARRAASRGPVGIIDADIGQSHIGPPTTVGWALVRSRQVDFRVKTSLFSQTSGTFASCYGFSQLTVGGISFVGDVTPVGHLLQLTAAIVQCVRQVSKATKLTIIDTPGFIRGPAATALWWTVQRILQPQLILAVQRDPKRNKGRLGTQCNDELSDVLAGLQFLDLQLELIKSAPQIPVKSPQQRRRYRQSQFSNYFRDSCLYNISLSDIAVQRGPAPPRGGASRNLSCESLVHRLVGLRAKKGMDIAIGVITDWQNEKDIVIIRAPKINIQQVSCLVIGDVTIDISDE